MSLLPLILSPPPSNERRSVRATGYGRKCSIVIQLVKRIERKIHTLL